MTRARALLLSALIVLLWADLAVSWVGVGQGWTEGNPLARWMLAGGLLAWVLLKAVASLAIAGLAYALRPKLAAPVLGSLIGAYTALLAWNVSVLL